MSGWTTSLCTGLAQALADAGIGAWNPAGTYADGQTGIFIRVIPTGPDLSITLSAYPVQSTPGLADVTVGVQIRVRGDTDPRTCDDLADQIYDLLDGISQQKWGGVDVVQAYRQSYSPLGMDTNRRWERSENYYVDAMRPTSNNTD